MSDRVFFDTNILLYIADKGSPLKQRIAQATIQDVMRNGVAVVSTQVLQEFYVCAVKKLRILPVVAKELLQQWRKVELVTVDADMIMSAIDCSILSHISFWDALVVVSAETARCNRLVTEDLNDGQVIRGVKIVNPFQDIAGTKIVRERGEIYASRGGPASAAPAKRRMSPGRKSIAGRNPVP